MHGGGFEEMRGQIPEPIAPRNKSPRAPPATTFGSLGLEALPPLLVFVCTSTGGGPLFPQRRLDISGELMKEISPYMLRLTGSVHRCTNRPNSRVVIMDAFFEPVADATGASIDQIKVLSRMKLCLELQY